jgi:PAS domain S-box-containing protein
MDDANVNTVAVDHYRLLFEAAPTPLLVLTPEFQIVAVSDSYLRATMTHRHDIVGRGLFEVFPDNPNDPAADGVQNLRGSLNKVLSARQPDKMAIQKYDVRRPIEEGGSFEERYWSPLNTPVLNDKGEIAYIVHQVEDVTSNMLTREALQESEEHLRLLVDGVKDCAIFMLDPSGRVASWNQGAERIKGYKAKEIVGRHFSCFYPPETVENRKPERELQTAVTEGHYKEEGWRIRKDGSRFWANVVITALRDETGKLRGFSKITRDITEHRRAEELLQESEERHRKLFDNNPHPTWVYDRETLQFLAVNAAAVRKYGYSCDEFLAMTIKDIRPPEDVPLLLDDVGGIRDGSESVGIWRHRRKDKTIIDVEITSYALKFEGRAAEVVVAVDVTQRKRDEAEKHKFTASLAASNQ